MLKNKKMSCHEHTLSSSNSTNLIPKASVHYILRHLFKQMQTEEKKGIEKRQNKHPNFLFHYYKAFQINKRLGGCGKNLVTKL